MELSADIQLGDFGVDEFRQVVRVADHGQLMQLELEQSAVVDADAVAVRVKRNRRGDVRIHVDFLEIDVLHVILEVVVLDLFDQRGAFLRAVVQHDHVDVVSGKNLPGVDVDENRTRLSSLAVNHRRDHTGFARAAGSTLPELFALLHRNFVINLAHGTPFLSFGNF